MVSNSKRARKVLDNIYEAQVLLEYACLLLKNDQEHLIVQDVKEKAENIADLYQTVGKHLLE